ncbi:hypothetical protein [Breoghania sp. L-A4]|uniref:hypothetical protein n=1 Tax=Breoghania sp. L-A4 TaxID=2304600 RepID=UPI003204CB38
MMGELWEALPPRLQGVQAQESRELEAALLADLRPGDVIMIKGSLGSKMGPLVSALLAAYASRQQPVRQDRVSTN